MNHFWQMIFNHTAVSVSVSAATVTVIVQALKSLVPKITGTLAIMATFAVSAGVVAVGHYASVMLGMNPGSLWTEAYLNQWIGVAAAASAVHGTVKSLFQQQQPPTPNSAAIGAPPPSTNPLNTTAHDPQLGTAKLL